jgi:hypothetical protein
LAHAHADVVLPGTALVAGNPRFSGIFILFGSSANTSDDFFLRLLGLGACLLPLFPAALGRVESFVELLQRLVLALGSAHRAAGFRFAYVEIFG